MRILVLGGGVSDEREVSFRSAKTVAGALISVGHEVTNYDPQNGMEGLLEAAKHTDVVFPVLHGLGGEDGTLQKVLEENSIAFVGTGSEASKLCFDKAAFKIAMFQTGIQMPIGKLVGREFLNSPEATGKFVLKPNDGGSSIDTFIVRQSNSSDTVDPTVFDRHPQMLYEELIEGTETTVSILDGKALPVIEIIPPETGEFDYENKYNGQTQEICPPKSLDEQVQSELSSLAERVYEASGARHMGRVDIMVDANKELYVLEINTIPGLTDQSLFPKAAQVAGISMVQLVDRLVNMAIKDQR